MLALVLALGLAGCGGGDGSDDEGETGSAVVDRSAEIAHIEAALERLNGAEEKVFLLPTQAFLDFGGVTRCGVGFSYEFPDYILVTVAKFLPPDIDSWAQLAVHPEKGIEGSSAKMGPDSALEGIDEAFWANLYPCEVRGQDIVFTGS